MAAIECRDCNRLISPDRQLCARCAELVALRERCERADREFASVYDALHSPDDNAMRLAKIAIAWSRYESPKHNAKEKA